MSRNDPNVPENLRSILDQIRSDGESSTNIEEVWTLLDEAAPSSSELPDAEETWKGVRTHLEEDSSAEARRASDRSPVRSAWSQRRRWRWVGAVAVVLVLAVSAWWWGRPISVDTVPGTTVTHTLPDGSTVDLNADSRLSYPRTFSTISILQADRRRVELRGEAYFDIESGERPFVVRTPTAEVEVVGTAFVVRSRAENEHATHVALEEGALRVTSRASSTTDRTLEPGQAVTMGPLGVRTPVRDTSLRRVTVWRRGGFAVTKASLPSIARSLERQFGTSIRLDASIPRTIRTAPLSLYYSQQVDVEDVLHDICMARNLTYRATANGYVLGRAGDTQASRIH